MSTTAPGAGLRAENLNTEGAWDYYEEPYRRKKKVKLSWTWIDPKP